jgi:2-polyprenyl-6-hydroxyphenyl methylase/3-demethylubiquinone-9 3-methyltransferase
MAQASPELGAGAIARSASVDPAEVAKFARIADEWWNPTDKFGQMHRANTIRPDFIRDRVSAHFGRDPRSEHPLAGLSMLDVGCGGGFLSEPMARLGARVMGIDAAEENVKVAAIHAAETGLEIDYRYTTAEAVVESGLRFDVVMNMEVVEHVADMRGFLRASAALVRPGGAMVVGTLNRTLKSFLLAIVAAEYVLGMVKRGTHDWRKFVHPSEIMDILGPAGLRLATLSGMSYDLRNKRWRLSDDTAINYMLFAVKDAE